MALRRYAIRAVLVVCAAIAFLILDLVTFRTLPGIRVPLVFAQTFAQRCPDKWALWGGWQTVNLSTERYLQWGCIDAAGDVMINGIAYAAHSSNLSSLISALPTLGGSIFLSSPGNYYSGALTVGAATQPVTVFLAHGVTLNLTGTLTLTSGSSIIGSGQGSVPASRISCRIDARTPCVLTTDDYANTTQRYNNGTRIENVEIECHGTGCNYGLETPATGLAMKIEEVEIDDTAAQCWQFETRNSSDWTEALLVENVLLSRCGGDGLDADVSSGGFFNDSSFINFQVRSQKGYFMKFVSGSNANESITRLTFDNFHGLVGTVTPLVSDGIFFHNGGGSQSLSDYTFIGGEIEGNSQTGYPFNGNGTGAGKHLRILGTTYDNFSGGIDSPNVVYDFWSGGGFSAAFDAFGDIGLLDNVNQRGGTFKLPPTGLLGAGVFATYTVPSFSGTLGLIGANGVSAGTVALSNGSGSHTFAAAYSSAPICTATDTTTREAVKITSSTTELTFEGNGSDVIAWQCEPAVN